MKKTVSLTLTIILISLAIIVKPSTAETYSDFNWNLTENFNVPFGTTTILQHGQIFFESGYGLNVKGTLIITNVTINGNGWFFTGSSSTIIMDGLNNAEINDCSNFGFNTCDFTIKNYKILNSKAIVASSSKITAKNNIVIPAYWTACGFKMWDCIDTLLENNTFIDTYQNAIRIGGGNNHIIRSNTIINAWHEAIFFAGATNVLVENNIIVDADVGVEAEINANNFIVRNNHIVLGRTKWGVALEAESSFNGEWTNNIITLNSQVPLEEQNSQAIKIESNGYDMTYKDNEIDPQLKKGFTAKPKQTGLPGATDILVINSVLPSIYIEDSFNIKFQNCTVDQNKVTIINSVDITFTDAQTEPPSEPTELYTLIGFENGRATLSLADLDKNQVATIILDNDYDSYVITKQI